MSLSLYCPKCGKVAMWQKVSGSSQKEINKVTVLPFYADVEYKTTEVYQCSNCGYKAENSYIR